MWEKILFSAFWYLWHFYFEVGAWMCGVVIRDTNIYNKYIRIYFASHFYESCCWHKERKNMRKQCLSIRRRKRDTTHAVNTQSKRRRKCVCSGARRPRSLWCVSYRAYMCNNARPHIGRFRCTPHVGCSDSVVTAWQPHRRAQSLHTCSSLSPFASLSRFILIFIQCFYSFGDDYFRRGEIAIIVHEYGAHNSF